MRVIIVTILFILLSSQPLLADEKTILIRQIIDDKLIKISRNPIIATALLNRNRKFSTIPTTEIIEMDKKWKKEFARQKYDFISEIAENDLSIFLKDIKNTSKNLFTNIAVLDERGATVGQSGISDIFWKGSKDSWKKTFLVGPGAVYISDIYFDDNVQAFQVLVSLVVSYEGEPIGVIEFGIDAEEL